MRILKIINILNITYIITLIPNMIYRDDDVNVYTNVFLFKELHKQFIELKQVHTVAVIMHDLWENHALFWYLATAPYLEVGLHGWEHKDYSKLSYADCYFDLKKSLDYWNENTLRMVGNSKKITTFFAPWNHESENIKKVCKDLGLEFCNIRKGYWHGQKVHSFHWWNIIDDNFRL
jgi:peptidoglycan/xylan/chitin deacetylase (PgdA/CDA1 family)